jgi:2-desacetyl-2-hydroxyethyl bacteriochlorophyllide A dehydrogenase
MPLATMKAIRLTAIGRPLERQEVLPRKAGAGELLVRVRAAGICHSDAHYRSGLSPMGALPITLGHEIAGVVAQVGPGVATHAVGDRVCLHYLVTCGDCAACRRGLETWCERGAMLGHHVDGGFAEAITVPARNAVPLPASIPFEHGAILMCSSATALHALRKGRLEAGERVAIFGSGGLGVSAVQLARALGAREVFAVDLRAEKLALAGSLGAIAVDAARGDPVAQLMEMTGGAGIDVALDFVGSPAVMRQAVRCLAPRGRAVLVALSDQKLELDPYREILGREAELIGSNDHTLAEITEVIELVQRGALDLSPAVTATVPLDAVAINGVLDALEQNRAGVRTVVLP